MRQSREDRQRAYQGPQERRYRAREWTFGRLAEIGHDFYLVCRNPECRRVVKFTVEEIRTRFPRDRETLWQVQHCHCGTCGARWPNVEGIHKHPKVGTIGDLLDRQFAINIYCGLYACRTCRTLTLEDLAAGWPREMPVQELLENLACESCGARWPDIDSNISNRVAAAGHGTATEGGALPVPTQRP